MSLRAAIIRILGEYPVARDREFAKDELAKFIRDEWTASIKSELPSSRYLAKASAGQGRWVVAPWLAIFDTLVTDSAQNGFYPVYLTKEDFSGLYLSMNQGVTSVRESHGAAASRALVARARDLQAKLGRVPPGFSTSSIVLGENSRDYEYGSVFARYYELQNMPEESELLEHLHSMLDAYLVLVERDSYPSSSTEREDDEEHFENTAVIRLHKRIERNRKLAAEVKRLQGLKCSACGFVYSDRYQGLNTNFIEAHHLTPLSELQKGAIKMDPLKDFRVLCANCHRMIHRSDCVGDVEDFSRRHLR